MVQGHGDKTIDALAALSPGLWKAFGHQGVIRDVWQLGSGPDHRSTGVSRKTDNRPQSSRAQALGPEVVLLTAHVRSYDQKSTETCPCSNGLPGGGT